MTLIAAASAHGSPGVSTALQLVASLWPIDGGVPALVEADTTGGVLAARYELGLAPGFVTLAESLRKFERPPLLDHAQRLPSGVACVPLSPSATAAGAQIRSAGPHLGSYLQGCGHPVLLDVGTATPDNKLFPAIAAADLLVWFVRPTREELLVLRHRLAEAPQPSRTAVVLVGETPYDATQVADALNIEVMHALPVDQRAADAVNLGGDDRYLRRSQLTRSCTRLVATLLDVVGSSLQPDSEPLEPAVPPPPASPSLSSTDEADGAPHPPHEGDLDVWRPGGGTEVLSGQNPDLVVWTSDD